LLVACGDPGDGAPADARYINGCPQLTAPQAQPGDPIDGDTWTTYAQGFFAMWCTRCHSTTLVGGARNGAPVGYNWDDPASVRTHLSEIRNAVGVANFMPFNPPDPTCAERQRIVRWIDAAAPGLP
jgi:uncharacterized membrane protein